MNLDLEGCIPFSPFPWLLHYNIDKVFVHIRAVFCLLSLVINKALDGYENLVEKGRKIKVELTGLEFQDQDDPNREVLCLSPFNNFGMIIYCIEIYTYLVIWILYFVHIIQSMENLWWNTHGREARKLQIYNISHLIP